MNGSETIEIPLFATYRDQFTPFRDQIAYLGSTVL